MSTPVPQRNPTVCPRCGTLMGGDRRAATALDGTMICEACQHAELDELIEQLERTAPGPAVPANLVPIEERRRAQSGSVAR